MSPCAECAFFCHLVQRPGRRTMDSRSMHCRLRWEDRVGWRRPLLTPDSCIHLCKATGTRWWLGPTLGTASQCCPLGTHCPASSPGLPGSHRSLVLSVSGPTLVDESQDLSHQAIPFSSFAHCLQGGRHRNKVSADTVHRVMARAVGECFNFPPS